MRRPFADRVIRNFIDEYLGGRTPNPCVLCNFAIKWGWLLEAAADLGAEHFATGHYARVDRDAADGRYRLLKAAHTEKDQSYALWRLSQLQLQRTRFPLGDLSKNQVRQIAAELGLPCSSRRESQEICFIPDDDYPGYLRRHIDRPIESGDIVDRQGRVVGRHRGAPFYTVGQRRGLELALGRPVYVIAIDAAANRIRIGDAGELLVPGLVAEQINWVSIEAPEPGESCEVRIRYRDPGYRARFDAVEPERVGLRFNRPRPAVTPGQSAVFYRGEVLLGGGIIVESLHSARE
jgi:tRNA-specific 2-thiouridylase